MQSAATPKDPAADTEAGSSHCWREPETTPRCPWFPRLHPVAGYARPGCIGGGRVGKGCCLGFPGLQPVAGNACSGCVGGAGRFGGGGCLGFPRLQTISRDAGFRRRPRRGCRTGTRYACHGYFLSGFIHQPFADGRPNNGSGKENPSENLMLVVAGQNSYPRSAWGQFRLFSKGCFPAEYLSAKRLMLEKIEPVLCVRHSG